MEENKIKELLSIMNYVHKNGLNNVYTKEYPFHDNYSIEVNFNSQKINYGDKIILGNTITSNFSKLENFVVLECINRLLEKGYKPENIELEKIYPSGHGHSGKLDILVHSIDGKSFLMIECKTFGSEFNKEYNNMLKNGGQLFTYYALDRNVQYLCLYSSHFINGKIEYKNNIINVNEEWRWLSTSEEIYLHWNKSFKDNGIFEQYALPYIIKHKALTYEMLTDLKEEDSGKIFNQIMEILRHNVVSDKPNAFNKLLNLFVCKIIDENKNETDELKFQWFDDDTDESLQMRLNDLYKDGMWRFLKINVTDYTEKQVDEVLQDVEANDNFKQTIKNMLINTRLKKSPNFAFKEVLDEKSFKANAKIVKEIVELLQGYKFRYKQKHQFLGDFFELLLNTSMKQEVGQFFTPVPITRFIISSLPIKEIINEKIKNSNNDNDILPTVIDYAMGSGHFLTEYMEQVQNIIDNIDESNSVPTVKNKIKTWRESEKFSWAKDYVYGIDLDDRLVKTAKVSAFFNGDGEANVIWANGLANFLSDEYRKKLKYVEPFNNKNNGQFDILISNPPYSVDAFKITLKDGEKSFDLYDYLTDNSKEIECLFVERMKQLLKVGGWAGVILPVSILSNSGIYSKTREIIFKYFKVKAIVELGSGTFMKTNTKTIILFLERRQDNEYKEIEKCIDAFFNNILDVTVNGIENAFSKFVLNVYDNLSFNDYIKIIKGDEVKHELYDDYQKDFNGNIEKIRQIEKEKILYFLLTYNQEISLIKTGQKQAEKNFWGYEFSESRGHEGLKKLYSGTKLYNENNLLDETKANYYIYNRFKGIKTKIDESLTENISYARMSNLFEYGTSKFDKRVNLNKKIEFVGTKFELQKLEKIVLTIESGNRPQGGVANITDGIISLGGEHIGNNGKIEINSNIKYVPENFYKNATKGKVLCNDILICKDGALTGKLCILPNDLPFTEAMINEHIFIVRANPKMALQKYLFVFLFSDIGQKLLKSNITGQAQGGLNATNLKNIKIPLPPLDIQQEIVDEVEKIDNKIEKLNMNFEEVKKKICSLINSVFDNYDLKRIGDYTTFIKRGKTAKYGNSNIQIIKSGQARGYMKFDFSQRYYVDEKFTSDERNLIKEDILINSTGVGTAGRVTLFNLDGNYVVDSHITIVRLNKKQLLPQFALYALAHIGFSTIEKMATGQSGQIELSIDTIKGIKIPVPLISEQQKIVSEIVKYENLLENAKNQINKLEIEKKNILDKYL